ncbi:MAG: peptidylprolyl isomerase [Bacteroidetes bacterium]|nr:peptidylprolyl isomerase [Bacteroidota bacterium]
MNSVKGFLATVLIASTFATVAQDKDPVLMTIAGKNITRSEFQSIYNKNNPKNSEADSKSIDDYVQLFVNFKLKVKEAEEMGLDTTKDFKNELEGYRKQLAQPYLTDNDVNDQLLREAYERSKTDVRASHILIKLDQNALPKDTIKAYNQIMAIRSRILKGEDFGKLARENSQDPSAKDNAGDLGYFTSMQMVYPFESMAYTTKPGEVSMPVRTRFGYHLIKVLDKRPAQGQIMAEHIMVKTSRGQAAQDSIAAKQKIDEIYAKIKAGENFEDLARQQSDDKGSAKEGGKLPLFGTGRMVMEFEKAAFALQNDGDYSEPVKTQYGWHIIKRLEKKAIPTFEESKADLKSKVTKDSRAQKSKESLVARIKKENNFKENTKARDEFNSLIDTTYFEGTWSKDKAAKLTKELFSLADKKYTQVDFANYLENHQTKRPKIDGGVLVKSVYDQFVSESCIAYQESVLDKKYPDFKALMQEYRDGILLFDLTDKKVWGKAVKDTAGIEEFYQKNKGNYMWEQRVDANIYTCADAKIAEQVRKLIKKQEKANFSNDSLMAMVNKNSQLNLRIDNGKFVKNENEFIDKVQWVEGLSENISKNNQIVFVRINKVLQPDVKKLNEARGLVTSDYQNYLEKEWIQSLRQKYPVSIDRAVLGTVK